MRDVIVAGGGPSGMVAAICCAREGKQVTILEQNETMGRKLLATGNGKCNFTNLVQTKDCYRGEVPSFGWQEIQSFDSNKCLEFFRNLGIHPYIKNGYCYPYSQQAVTILTGLKAELERLHVKTKYKEHITKIQKTENGYALHTETYVYECKRVILACGGMSGNIPGADESGYTLAKMLGHTLTPLFPALVGLKTREGYFNRLAGIRTNASFQLWIDEGMEAEASGEIQLTAYGISGIPVFQVSRFAARALLEGKTVNGVIILLPDLTEEFLVSFFQEQKRINGFKTVLEMISGFLDRRLVDTIVQNAKIKGNQSLDFISTEQIKEIVKNLKNWKVSIKNTNGYQHAQVTGGGIPVGEVFEKTLESKIAPGVYIVGEMLDIDGTCGGYNLHWAWTSGYLAGVAAGK